MGSRAIRTTEPIRIGENFELDAKAYELRRSGRTVKLERIPMELLLLLVERSGELVSREEIVERIWGKDVYLDCDNSVNAAIRKIRQALKDDSERPRFIQTVTGKGYRFIANVAEPSALKSEPSISPENSADNRIGKKISHYRVLQLLGGGGMGVVYKAEDLKLGRSVAMKFLPGELARDGVAFARLQREARAGSSLEHANICAVYELDECEGQPFIVMPFLQGQTLREWIQNAETRDTPERVRRVLDLAIQICRGLEAAHEKGILHRDIKPANIFITHRGEAKILDFGVAKFLREARVSDTYGSAEGTDQNESGAPDSSLTQTGLSPGTPSYLSPEQVRREPLDARSDLFSLGLVLYEMLTGQRAFGGNTAGVIRQAILSVPTLPIRAANPQLPPALESIVQKALEKDRDGRYQSAAELRIELERYRERTKPASWWAPHRRLTRVAGLVLLAGLTSAAIWTARPHETSRVFKQGAGIKTRRSVAVLGFRNLSGHRDEDWISTAFAEMLNTELASGEQIRVIPGENVAHMQLDLALPAVSSYGPDTLKKIRKSLGSDVVVLGSYLTSGTNAGQELRLDVQLQDATTGELIAAFSQVASEGDIPAAASRAGAILRSKLGIPAVPVDSFAQVQQSLPSVPEAARAYSEGLAKLREFDALAARDLLQKAVTIEPGHALSHSALAEALSQLGYDGKAQEESKRAFELSHNLARPEQLLIEARYREFSHDLPAAIDIYRTLWNFFPDDLEYGLSLAAVETKSGKLTEALSTIGQMHRLPEPQGQDLRISLVKADAEQRLGDYAHARDDAARGAGAAEALGERLVMARALHKEGYAADHLGDRQTAMAAFRKARDIWAAAGDKRGAASAVHSIAMVQYHFGDYQGSEQSYREALEVFRKIGAEWDVASCSNNLGILLQDEGKLDEAKQAFEEALRIQREIKDDAGVASDLDDLSNVLFAMGQLSDAARMKEQAVQLFEHAGNRAGAAITLTNLGEVLLAEGRPAEAGEKLEASLSMKRSMGYKQSIAYALFDIAEVLRTEDRLQEARATAMESLGIRKELGNEVDIAASETQLAEIALDQNDAREAESLARAAVAVFQNHQARGMDCVAEATLAETLARRARREAQATVEHALSLAQHDVGNRLLAKLALADVVIESNPKHAAEILESVRAESHRLGYVGYGFQAELRLAELEIKAGQVTEGREQLAKLEHNAKAQGFALIARRAEQISKAGVAAQQL